jgi:hypothetical protein
MTAPYSSAAPFITHVGYQDGVVRPYEPLFDLDDDEGKRKERFGPSFECPGGILPTADVLQLLFLSESLIEGIVVATNAYAKKQLVPAKVHPVDEADILRFFAIFFYMGIVRVPAKKDYWRGASSFWPVHQPCLSLPRTRFEYIWRYIHLTETDDMEEDIEIQEEMDGEDREGETFGGEHAVEEEDAVENNDEEPSQPLSMDPRWWAKAAPFIDHVNAISQCLCRHPGSMCSIDEMMKKFKGQSAHTTRIKNKPIKEGYKFFYLCDASTGYVFNFIPDPDGRLVHMFITDVVLTLVESLPQQTQLEYIVGMDNYFTFPKVLAGMRRLNVGCIGTARYRSGWPPTEMRQIEDPRFNTVYLMNDEKDFKIARWIDNNVVTMVSTVHTGEESVEKDRRKPRLTRTNRNHILPMWGLNAVIRICIPRMIDDYNHWMLGVDKADQLIAYYRSSLRCRRVWLPLMMHALDILRVNAFIIAKSKDDRLVHKEFVVTFIECLLQRATFTRTRATRARTTRVNPRRSPPSMEKKRRRISKINPRLPEYRFNGQREGHQVTLGSKQRACTYCSYLRSLSMGAGTPLDDLPKVKTVTRSCSACKDSLCKDHFALLHTRSSAAIII